MNKIIINKIKKNNWKKWGTRRVTFRWAENIMNCTLYFSKYFGPKFTNQLIIIENEIAQCYVNKNQLNNILNYLLKKIYSKSFFELYEKQALKIFSSFLKFCKNFDKNKLSKMSNNSLSQLLNKFVIKEDNFNNFLWIIFILDEYIVNELKKELKKYFKETKQKNNFDHYLNTILFPEKKSAIFKQKLDILHLAEKIKNKKIKKSILNIEFKKLTNKYAYFNILNFDEPPLNIKYFRKEVSKILKDKKISPEQKIKKINNQFNTTKINFKKILNDINKNSKLFKLINTCHEIAYYRDHRNDVRREGYYYASKLYIEIAKRLKISLSDLLFLSRKEIKKSLKENKIIIKKITINQRKKYSALYFDNKKIHFIYDKNEITKLLNCTTPKILSKKLRGIPASPGKILGKIKIIISPMKNGSKLKIGDVLATSMTNIDFLPLMSKASAIITDEGGLLCHAAIISREMKKPCIVGTKNATQIFKDGDLVEVDANKGIVKKINLPI